MGKIFVCDTSLSEKFSWMEANHENNEIKSTMIIFTYTVCPRILCLVTVTVARVVAVAEKLYFRAIIERRSHLPTRKNGRF